MSSLLIAALSGSMSLPDRRSAQTRPIPTIPPTITPVSRASNGAQSSQESNCVTKKPTAPPTAPPGAWKPGRRAPAGEKPNPRTMNAPARRPAGQSGKAGGSNAHCCSCKPTAKPMAPPTRPTIARGMGRSPSASTAARATPRPQPSPAMVPKTRPYIALVSINSRSG